MESLGLKSSGSDQGPARHREYTCALHTGPGPILRPIRGPGLSKNRAEDSTPSVTISKLRLLGVQASCTSNKVWLRRSGTPIIMGSEGAVVL